MLRKFAVNRLKEASTYRGFIVLLGIFGVSMEPKQADAIIAACIAMYAVAASFFPDKFGEKEAPPVQAVESVPPPMANKPISRVGKDARIPGQFP